MAKSTRTSLNSIRYRIKMHLNDKNIINGSEFRKSKDMFIAVTKDLKRDGKGGIHHYPPVEDADLMESIHILISRIALSYNKKYL